MFQANEEQKDKWHEQRWAKFTASSNYRLLGSGKPGELFGQTAWSYIQEKAIQECTHKWERPQLEFVESLLHGSMYEYPAFKEYVIRTGYDMIYLGTEHPLFLDDEQLMGHSGGSPDTIAMNNNHEITRMAEIKCPKNPMNHFQRLKWKDQWDIKEKYIEAYCQIQNLLKISNSPYCDFVSFDERMKSDKLKMKIITVYPDKKFQDNLHFRLVKAIEEKKRIVEDIMTF